MAPIPKVGDYVIFKKDEHKGEMFPVLGVRRDARPGDPLVELAKGLAALVGQEYIEIQVLCCKHMAQGFWYSWDDHYFELISKGDGK